MDHVQARTAEVTEVLSSNFQPQSTTLFLNIVFLAQIKHSILLSVVLIQVC